MTLDTKALEAAEVAWRASIHPTCKGMLTAAIEAYLSQAATPSRNDILEEAARGLFAKAEMALECGQVLDGIDPRDILALRPVKKEERDGSERYLDWNET